jgi:hypothetical protein
MSYVDAVVADSPQAYWRFSETSGTVAEPTVGANHGTYTSMYLNQPGLLMGDNSPSVYFDGIYGHVTTPGTCGVGTAPMSIEMWCKPDQDATIGLFDSAPLQTNCIRNYDGDRFEWWSISPYITYNFLKGTTYHVVLTATIDGDGKRRLRLYINGSQYQTQTGVNGGTTVTAWRFGDINNGQAGLYKGWMQDVALYNKELSAARVLEHYKQGSINIMFRQALQLDSGGGVGSYNLIPLWADGEKTFYSSPFGPMVEFRGFIYPVDDVPVENWGQNWVIPTNSIPWSVDLGWCAPSKKLPFGAAGWLHRNRKALIEMGGITGLLLSWNALQPGVSVVPHIWNVATEITTGEIAHSWTVKTEAGGALPHIWRVGEPKLVILHGQDIQLPYGHLEKT